MIAKERATPSTEFTSGDEMSGPHYHGATTLTFTLVLGLTILIEANFSDHRKVTMLHTNIDYSSPWPHK